MFKPNKDGKYVFPPSHFTSIFLPSTAEVARLLLLPENIPQQITFFERVHEIDSKIAKSSKANILTQGVSLRTLTKLYNFGENISVSFKIFFTTANLLKLLRPAKAGSNAGDWFALGLGISTVKNDNELFTLGDWLISRSEADYVMLKTIKKQIKIGEIDKNDYITIWQALLPTWQHYSLVPLEQLAYYTLYLNASNGLKSPLNEPNQCLYEAVHHLIFDFYLTAIAHYEVGLYQYYQRQCDTFEPYGKTSFFSKVMHTFAHSDVKCCCYEAVLIELKRFLSSDDTELSWRAMAAFIPIKNSADTQQNYPLAESLIDRQYNQLKYWRNGENLPSEAKLEAFLTALFNQHGNYDVQAVLTYFRIARAIDIKINECVKLTPDIQSASIREKVLARYPTYFEHYRAALIKK
ncbi:hypothetical protein L5M11_18950 [Shewanella sp. SM87]|uniref:hypothetical protein n=1 Tax=Shewanella sp. SM87 TaxID=2912808 RepID=UPI0021DA462C|nr:hypothetical protein [Shewanella sp. SM87]MCU8009587.1 hypothetical protein [Shewanella sp. SM87]